MFVILNQPCINNTHRRFLFASLGKGRVKLINRLYETLCVTHMKLSRSMVFSLALILVTIVFF